MPMDKVFPHVLFSIGGVEIYDSVAVTWLIMAVLTLVSWVVTRNLRLVPTGFQNVLESMLEKIEMLIQEISGYAPVHFLPLIAALAIYLAVSNLVSIVPGLDAPTRDLNTTTALAVIVFLSVHVLGIRLIGARNYFRSYIEPSWILLPFNIVGELTRTIALSLRLFGNMLSGTLIVAILVLFAGLLVPVPLQIFGLLLGFIQAYVFTLLATVYIAAGLESEREHPQGGQQ